MIAWGTFQYYLIEENFSPDSKQTNKIELSDLAINPNEVRLTNISPNSLSSCIDFSFTVDNVAEWKRHKKLEISSYLSSLVDRGVKRQILDEVYISSGIGWTYGRMLETKRANRPYHSDYFKEQLEYSNSEKVILHYVKNQDFSALLTLYKSTPSELNKVLFLNTGESLPIISTLIKLELNSQNYSDIYDFALKLSHLGEKVRYIDLITATEHRSDVVFLEQLFILSELNSNEIFIVDSVYESLATIAARANNIPALLFWLRQGVEPNPDMLSSNALDLLQAPNSENEFKIYEDAFLALMELEVRANSELTHSNLIQWVSPVLITQYEQRISPREEDLYSKRDIQLIYKYSLGIYEIATDNGNTLPVNDRNKEQCLIIAGQRLTDLIFDFELNKIPTESIIKTTTIDHFKERAAILIENTKLSSNKLELSLSNLINRTDLVSKLAYTELKRENVLEKIRERNKDFGEKYIPSQIDEQLQFLVFDRMDYLGAFNLIQNSRIIDEQRTSWLTIILTEVINRRFDRNLISLLIDEGAYLNPMELYSLIDTHQLDKIKYLRKKGLNIHYVHPYGQNAIWYSVKSKSSILLKYFIESNVEVNISAHGVDPLDISLAQIQIVENGVEFVDLLIESGINIHSSHRESVEQIKMISPNLYSLITERYPELL